MQPYLDLCKHTEQSEEHRCHTQEFLLDNLVSVPTSPFLLPSHQGYLWSKSHAAPVT